MAEHFRGGDPGHLPNRRSGGEPADPDDLPRQRRGTTPQMHGRYPDWDVLAQSDHWDEVTRKVVLARVNEPPSFQFFDERERHTLKAFCDVVTAQDREPRIPVLSMVDAKLHAGQLDGFQYADMPDDREVWRIVARGLDEAGFADAQPEARREIVARMSKGELSGGAWDELDVATAWKVVTRAMLAAFYSHPWAWNEIGFGGPAYPRGYAALGIGKTEGWEPQPAFDLDPVTDTQERGLE
ncbi:MAG TPA: gluconate 2-dehydrogenase subunit 3 family protein [Thermoleophilaceae bacterium]